MLLRKYHVNATVFGFLEGDEFWAVGPNYQFLVDAELLTVIGEGQAEYDADPDHG